MNDATPYIPESFSTLSLPQRRDPTRWEITDKSGARARKARRKATKAARRRNRR